MKRLSLTSRFLGRLGYDRLIQVAAAAAQKMPQLECMELWNGEKGFACVFRYQRGMERARISLLSTWCRQKLGTKEWATWREVASGQGISNLEVENVSLDPSLIKSHVSVIPLLLLGKRLLEPISLRQMQLEIDHK